MGATIGQRESHQEGFDSKDPAELRHNGDAAAFAYERDVTVEGFSQRVLCGFAKRRLRVSHIPRPAVPVGNLHRYSFGEILSQMRLCQSEDFITFLLWNKTER